MRLHLAPLSLLCLALAAVPAVALRGEAYDNGPVNGTTDAWFINFGFVVSDSFVTTGRTPPASCSACGSFQATR